MAEVSQRRDPREPVSNPCSGRYEAVENGLEVEVMVDIDRTTEYSKALAFVSGTIKNESGSAPWPGSASAVYFKIIPATFSLVGDGEKREVKASAKVFYNDGTRYGGSLSAEIQFSASSRSWKATIELEIGEERTISFKHLERKSKFFKHIGLDIDFTEKVIWPVVVVADLMEPPIGMSNRKIDAFQAFEDAGLKLVYDQSQSEKLEDPTPENPWTKSDLFEAMMAYFDEVGKHENIWCMMGTTPPDKRYMGFSFDRKGKHGFGLFTDHKSFTGLEASCPKTKSEAQRRLLHYLVHECGHCLGLKHPFEIGAPDSLSWMNYAWRYDVGREPGSFYRDFRFTFSDQELVILRHSPGKSFRSVAETNYLNEIVGSGYKARSEAPDKHQDHDDDGSDETEESKMRQIGLDLKMPKEYSMGQLLSFEARIKNQGKLPALIEGDLSLESGNLQVYVTKPDGSSDIVEPFVRPVHTGYSKPRVLYTSSDEEGSDRYSELVTIGQGSDGYHIDKPGTYQVRAVYNGGRYNVSSVTYTINVAEADDEDKETADEVLTASTLKSSNYNRFQKTLDYWKKLETEPLEKKKSKVASLITLFEGLASEHGREARSVTEQLPSKKRKITFAKTKPAIDKQKLLKDTSELVHYYQEKGKKDENLDYSNLVLARGRVYVTENMTEEGNAEFNKMLNDLVVRGVKYDVIAALSKKWNKIKNPPKREEKYTAASLQKKVNDVLTWAPTAYGDGESDLSGIGLGTPFSNFDIDQIQKATKIVEMLFTKFDETQDLRVAIGYADKLQKGREVNNMVLRWALEAFIVHSDDAKKAGIRYPEPEKTDQSLVSDAALVATRRVGQPSEEWLNYWRCDADFNYHHRHWHIVYVVGQFLRRTRGGSTLSGAPPHLERQGELFGYMHSQMLARYDAERESWGLLPVTAFRYEDFAPGFNAGMEFHNDRQWSRYAPRPNQRWPRNTITRFRRWEAAYNAALSAGTVAPGIELNPNWSGHVLEPSSQIYAQRFGSYHNSGHGVFGSTGLSRNSTSYMNDTATAVRDPIFYRWHKKIDDLWQANNIYYRSDLNADAPPVTITADDIVLSTDRNPPSNFTNWSNGDWVGSAPSQEAVLRTFLGPAHKKYEWDNKLSHEKFYYHLRLKRNPGTSNNRDLPLTIRIFICPTRRQAERTRWIEMDKFVCSIASGTDHIEITRADVHSSVIKRLRSDLEGDEPDMERRFVRTLGGFCECGWPYDMLLPRGTTAGEDYTICVIATDNSIDSIGVRTTCGSLSYCGARGQRYPDTRYMGYPFCNPITISRQNVGIPAAFDRITNAAYKNFKIQNNTSEPPRMNAVDVWWPYTQLRVNDGTLRRELRGGVTEYIRSSLVGSFRVLIDNDAAAPSRARRILVRFQGRGPGGGAYAIRDVHLALRRGNTLDIVSGSSTRVRANGQDSFTVPETGIISDALAYRFDPTRGDYFLTFTLESPGAHLPSSQNSQTSTYFIPSDRTGNDVTGDWSGFSRVYRRFPFIQCIAGIMAET